MTRDQAPPARREPRHASPSRTQTSDRTALRALQVAAFLTVGAAVLLLPVQAMVLFVLLTATAASIAVYNMWIAHHWLEARRRRALNHRISEIAFAVLATGLVAATIFPTATVTASFYFAVGVCGVWSLTRAAQWLGLMQPLAQGATKPAAPPGLGTRDMRRQPQPSLRVVTSSEDVRARPRTAA